MHDRFNNGAAPLSGECARTARRGRGLARARCTASRIHQDRTEHRRAPSAAEAGALRQLDDALVALGEAASAEDIQTAVYTIGKDEAHGFASLRDWFKALYEILLGSEQGPRMGSFIALYGVPNTRALIAQALAGE